MSQPKPVLLDVEDDDRRQARIRALLERLNASSSPAPPPRRPPILASPPSPPCNIEPPADLIARVQAFLPAIHASNEALSQKNPADVDIENVGDDDEQYIEMNLGLGVFEARRNDDDHTVSSSSSSSPSVGSHHAM